MEYSLSERVAKRQSQKKNSGGSKNKFTFIVQKNDIVEALSAGWSMKSIWELLTEENKISFSYKTFRVYVAQFITSEMEQEKQENTKEDKKNKSKAKGEIPGFTFDPIPNLKELF